jgi:hypothetical protein
VTTRRSWETLSRVDAQDLLEGHVAGHPGRVAMLLERVRSEGGPIEALDFSRASLGPLWAWILATSNPPARPATGEEMVAEGELPWW